MAPSTRTPTFRETVALVAARAQAKLPQAVNGRIESAVKLVLAHDVTFLDNGTVEVGSASDPVKVHVLTGTSCDCQDFLRAPESWCKHRVAAAIYRRVQEALAAEAPDVITLPTEREPWADNDMPADEPVRPALDAPAPAPDPAPAPQPTPAPVETPAGIDPRHVVLIQGRAFVKYAGLVDLAHQRGLQSLTVDWTHNEAELSLAHAVATFPFGQFEESADSTPLNVGKKVALHWRRLSLTRAKARCLRDALAVDMVALEELGDE